MQTIRVLTPLAIKSDQHGSMKSSSCLTNILETLEDWTKALDSSYGIDIICFDYQKAFDTQKIVEKN